MQQTRRLTYRLYPNKQQEKQLHSRRSLHKSLYNACLYQRTTEYKRFGRSIGYYDQQNLLPEFKKEWPEYKELGSQALQATVKRVDYAFSRFFQGLGKYPRYKSIRTYRGWTYPSTAGWKAHTTIANQRQDWQHRVVSQIVSSNGLVATEKLNLKGMTRKAQKGKRRKQKTGLNRNLLDVGIGNLISFIKYKLNEVGGVFVDVPLKIAPSQTCPECGRKKKKELSERVHNCKCGCKLDWDVAAAQVMLNYARALGTSVLNRGGEASTSKPTRNCGSWKQAASMKRKKPRT